MQDKNEVVQDLFKLLSEGFGGMAGMFFKEADKIRNVFVAQTPRYLIDLAGGCQQLSLCFEDDMIGDHRGAGFAERVSINAWSSSRRFCIYSWLPVFERAWASRLCLSSSIKKIFRLE